MPEARTFGRRGVPQTSFVQPAFEPLVDEAPDTLDSTAQALKLSAVALAFGGLLTLVIAAIILARQPADTSFLRILIPEELWQSLTFTSPRHDPTGQTLLPMAATLAWPLLMVLGLVALWRRAWVLIGLCFAALCFPWGVFGVALPYGAMGAAILIVFCTIRLFELTGLRLIVTVMVGFLVGGPAVTLVYSTIENVVAPGMNRPVIYQSVQFSDLAANGANLAAPAQISTLAGLRAETPEKKAALAFVMVQEMTLRKDVAGVQYALATLAASGFVPNLVEQRRIDVAHAFLDSVGANGEGARLAFERRAGVNEAVDGWVAVYLPILVVLVSLGLALFSVQVQKRRARIDVFEAALSERRSTTTDEAPAGPRTFGRRAPEPQLQSITAIDGEAALRSIANRLGFYRKAAIVLGSFAAIAIGAGLMMWLPPAASNTAFAEVALHMRTMRWATAAGLPVQIGLPPFDQIVASWAFPALALILAFCIFFKRYAIFAAAPAFAIMAVWQVASLFFVDQAQFELSLQAITPTVRAELQDYATPAEKFGPRNAPRTAEAAYIMAQLAYLENRPQEVDKYLQVVATDPVALDQLVNQQRIDLMAAWAGANGYPTSAKLPNTYMVAPMSFSRMLALPVTVIGSIAALIAIVALVLLPIAAGRQQRIEGLMARTARWQA